MDYSIVVPVYNSSNTLSILLQEITYVMRPITDDYEVIFVDDCSPDESWLTLKKLKASFSKITIIRLAKNVGQWMATLAGISESTGKLIITIDDDLEYDTVDITHLINEYKKQKNKYLIYGIPIEKENKNLSYKLFFKLRNNFLRMFFNKIQTESFKIFDRAIYFNPSTGEMFSQIHFEAFTKLTLQEEFVGYLNVNYRNRYEGNSNHTLWMKIKMLKRYGIEYFKSPFRYLLYLLVLFSVILFGAEFIPQCAIITPLVKLFACLTTIFVTGILGNYLSHLYFKLKGLPEFIIIEKI